MDVKEIKDIMDIAAKLQASFRHIRYLCGKYEELEKGGNSYEPYNTYPYMQGNYGPPPGYPYDPYYQPPYNPVYGYPPHQIPPPYPMGNFPINKMQQMSDPSKANKIPIQKEKTQKMPNNPNKSSSNNKSLNQHKNSSPSNTKIHGKKESLQSKSYPQSPYHIFLKSKKTQIKNEYPHLMQSQLLQIMLEVWKSFTEKQKKPYELEYKRLKQNFLQNSKEQNFLSKSNSSNDVKNSQK